LDADFSVGGVWSEARLYPGLKSNNIIGTYEYSDFPMDSATYGVKHGEHIPGAVLHRYLTDYAKKFNVYGKIQFNTKVQSAERRDRRGWLLTVLKSGKESQVFAKKLIVATGMTSEPFLPKFSGGEIFGVPLFHIKQFKEQAHILETAKTVTVFGGTKSAWDAVYACSMKGIKVDWVIRGIARPLPILKPQAVINNRQNLATALPGWHLPT
jgi:cation diffusion facilitator CzcD-associated flavoprotein CzcO